MLTLLGKLAREINSGEVREINILGKFGMLDSKDANRCSAKKLITCTKIYFYLVFVFLDQEWLPNKKKPH